MPHWTIAPYFLVDDVVTTANYYRDKLGFHYERFFGDPPAFCMVKRSGVVIMLSCFPRTQPMRPNRLADPLHLHTHHLKRSSSRRPRPRSASPITRRASCRSEPLWMGHICRGTASPSLKYSV